MNWVLFESKKERLVREAAQKEHARKRVVELVEEAVDRL